MHSIFIWLLSCKGCGSCWYMPGAPNVEVTDPPPFDTSVDEPEEDTAEEPDLPPSSVCDLEEIEPNNEFEDPQELPLEQWMCGTFGQSLDGDVFGFDLQADTWIRVWIRAAQLGSKANPRIFIFDQDEEFTADITNTDQEDIDRTFKIDEDREMGIGLFEEEMGSSQFGEEYFWRMRVSIVKAPVEWDIEEDEPNDDRSEAMPILSGDRIYGSIENSSRNDWYSLEIDEPGSTVAVDTESWTVGSPLYPVLEVIYEDGSEDGEQKGMKEGDRKVSFTAESAGTYMIRVGAAGRGGGIPYWYVLDVAVEPGADTAAGG